MSATLEGERPPRCSAARRWCAAKDGCSGDDPLEPAARPGRALEARVAATVLQALDEEAGSLLVFLPGQAEIRRTAERLAEQLPAGVLLCPLHGELELAAQRAAIEPAPPGSRKVVLATSIAETSLTIEGCGWWWTRAWRECRPSIPAVA